MALINDMVDMLFGSKVTILMIFVVLCSLLWMKTSRPRHRKLPPGLPSIPILGSIPWMTAGISHLASTQYAKKYGKTYTVDLGRHRVLILTGHRGIREAMVEQAATFADRPSSSCILTGDLNPEHRGFGEARYDWTYIRNKKAAMSVLHDFGLGESGMETRILAEATELLGFLVKQEGKPCNPKDVLFTSVSNVISAVLFNKRYSHEDIRFNEVLHTLHELVDLYTKLMIIQFIPLVRFLPWTSRNKKALEQKNADIHQFIQEELCEQVQLSDPNDHERDFISAFMHKMGGNVDPVSLENIATEFFCAGTHTTATALRWALIYMANNPGVQTRVHEEIDKVIGEGRKPSMSDKTSLNFTEAVILETLRKSSAPPFTIPHSLTADTELQGFFLKKGSMVMTNIYAVHHDPDVWSDPEKFNPHHFLNEQGDVTGREKIASFGHGRRSCLGEPLARQELYLFLTSILQRFKVLPPPGQTKVTEEAAKGYLCDPLADQLVFTLR